VEEAWCVYTSAYDDAAGMEALELYVLTALEVSQSSGRL
jgi:hypothetical protein